jgi:effector-binding domain-containing protein
LERRIQIAGVRATRPPGTLFRADAIEVYVPVRRAAPGVEARRLAAVRAATLLHRGSYEGFDATEQVLREWIAAAGLQPAGGQRIVYLQFGAEADLRLPDNLVVRNDADLLTEIQVPLR